MGFILSKIIEFFTKNRNNFKIIILGMQNAGKTTILYRLSLGQMVKTTPTIGSNVEELTYNNVKFQAWDLGAFKMQLSNPSFLNVLETNSVFLNNSSFRFLMSWISPHHSITSSSLGLLIKVGDLKSVSIPCQ